MEAGGSHICAFHLHSCGLRDRLLIKNTSKDKQYFLFQKTRKMADAIFTHYLSATNHVASVAKKRAWLDIWHCRFCVWNPEDIPLGNLALIVIGACIHRFNGMVAKKQIVFKWLSSQIQYRGSRQKYFFSQKRHIYILWKLLSVVLASNQSKPSCWIWFFPLGQW